MTIDISLSARNGLSAIGIIGEPACGKTTLMRAVIAQAPAATEGRFGVIDFLHIAEWRLMILGSYRGHLFDGTDRLSIQCYAQADVVLRMAKQRLDVATILWEGDKFARARWIDSCEAAGFHVNLIHVVADRSKTNERRKQRGTKQSEAWVNGRRTLCSTLALRRAANIFDLVDLNASRRLADHIAAHCRQASA